MRKTVEIEIEYGKSGLPHLAPRPGARLRTKAFGKQVHITGNREGLLLLAHALVGLANLEERPEHAGYHVHVDDLYSLNDDGSELILYRE